MLVLLTSHIFLKNTVDNSEDKKNKASTVFQQDRNARIPDYLCEK